MMGMMGPMARDHHAEQARITANMSQDIAPNLKKEDFMRAAKHIDMDHLLGVLAQLQGAPLSRMPGAEGVK